MGRKVELKTHHLPLLVSVVLQRAQPVSAQARHRSFRTKLMSDHQPPRSLSETTVFHPAHLHCVPSLTPRQERRTSSQLADCLANRTAPDVSIRRCGEEEVDGVDPMAQAGQKVSEGWEDRGKDGE